MYLKKNTSVTGIINLESTKENHFVKLKVSFLKTQQHLGNYQVNICKVLQVLSFYHTDKVWTFLKYFSYCLILAHTSIFSQISLLLDLCFLFPKSDGFRGIPSLALEKKKKTQHTQCPPHQKNHVWRLLLLLTT